MSVRKITALALSTALVIATAFPAAAQRRGDYWRGDHGHHGGLSTGQAIGLGLGAAALGAAVAAPYAYGSPAYGYSSGGYWANQCQYWDGQVWHWMC